MYMYTYAYKTNVGVIKKELMTLTSGSGPVPALILCNVCISTLVDDYG
jgi:hypothetical protein